MYGFIKFQALKQLEIRLTVPPKPDSGLVKLGFEILGFFELELKNLTQSPAFKA